MRYNTLTTYVEVISHLLQSRLPVLERTITFHHAASGPLSARCATGTFGFFSAAN